MKAAIESLFAEPEIRIMFLVVGFILGMLVGMHIFNVDFSFLKLDN